jgi:hypothetical protein
MKYSQSEIALVESDESDDRIGSSPVRIQHAVEVTNATGRLPKGCHRMCFSLPFEAFGRSYLHVLIN